jgi:hypothetical protein
MRDDVAGMVVEGAAQSAVDLVFAARHAVYGASWPISSCPARSSAALSAPTAA